MVVSWLRLKAASGLAHIDAATGVLDYRLNPHYRYILAQGEIGRLEELWGQFLLGWRACLHATHFYLYPIARDGLYPIVRDGVRRGYHGFHRWRHRGSRGAVEL